MSRDPQLPLFDPARFEEDRPRAEFVAELRRAFVSESGLDGAVASDEPATRERLRRVLAAGDAADAPGAAFAEGLRRRFVEGAPVLHLRPKRRQVLAAVAAVAALVLVFVLGFGSGSQWHVFNAPSDVATIDGGPLRTKSVRVGDSPCTLCTGDNNLRLGLGDDVRIELSAHATARLRCTYSSEGGLTCVPIAVDKGELVALKRDTSVPIRFEVETEAAFVSFTGTALSVFPHNQSGSLCVVVRSGEATIESKGGGREIVHATSGQRVLVRRDGSIHVSERYEDERRLRNLEAACDDLAGGRFESEDYSRSWNALEAF